jgi:CBS-domain-containing membrane protein
MRERTRFVADVMTMDPVVVRSDASLEEAEDLLTRHAISGLPVVDRFGALVGVLSQSDIIEASRSAVGRIVRSAPSGLRVGELMSSPAVTIAMTDRLDEAARRMLGERVHRLVAIDDAGHPVGVLSATDFVRLYADLPA